MQFLRSVETLSSDLYHETANELRYNISKVSLPVNVNGEQFEQYNRDFNKYGIILTDNASGFGGLVVACWPLVPKFAGSNPAEAVRFLRGK